MRVAVVLMSVLAGLLLLNAGLTLYGREGVAEAVAEGSDISQADAERFILLWAVPYLVIGLVLAVSAWFLPRRQAWARWTGLAASLLLALLTLFGVVAAGGVTVASLLLLVLSVAAVTSLLARTTAGWVPKLRG